VMTTQVNNKNKNDNGLLKKNETMQT